MKHALDTSLAGFPRVEFTSWVTPLEHQSRLSAELGLDLWLKRDDLTGLAFGGNKVRQLEYYFGEALAKGADSVAITGAVQSNFVRLAAAGAARLGMDCHVQLEERVADVDSIYRRSGNVLVDELLGAQVHSFPTGEDEAAADAAVEAIAETLRQDGRRPYVIHLAAGHKPLGALGYVRCAAEILTQRRDMDAVVVGSGSGQTHAGLLFGLRSGGWDGPVFGICVRRPARAQSERILACCRDIARLLQVQCPVRPEDVELLDHWLAPGYGTVNAAVAEAISTCGRLEGLLVDPVYTGRVLAGAFALAPMGRVATGANVVVLHSGGLPALFGYETALRRWIIDR